MLKSMTGFGKSTCQLQNRTVLIEVKTLNSKTLDMSIRLPVLYKGFEQEIRNMLSRYLVRGKVDFFIGFENGTMLAEASVNIPLMEKYFREISGLYERLGMTAGPELLPALLRFPDIFSAPVGDNGLADWEPLMPAIMQAIEQADAFRTSEGRHLENDLMQRITAIGDLLSGIDPFEGARMENLRARLLNGLRELGENVRPDENRFEQELIYYLEKLDISEEKVRLVQHLDYFKETMGEGDSSGKKLGFIAQEIGREINTIGSKASDAGIQRLVVQMKDELEKVKEQLMNIL